MKEDNGIICDGCGANYPKGSNMFCDSAEQEHYCEVCGNKRKITKEYEDQW